MLNIQEDDTQKGIWRYWRYLPELGKKWHLTLSEGSTLMVKKEDVFFKREDLNPTGSLKDRGLAYQISKAFSEGEKNLVISSSGNAAISAAAYCQLAGINLFAFVSPNISLRKLEKIKKYGGIINISKKPVSDSTKFSKEKDFKNLRPSIESFGSEGYKTIAFEIFKEVGEIEDIFLPVSSATSLVGIADGFKELGCLPRIHACQSTKVNPIALEFDKDFIKTETSLTDALVAKVTPKKEEAIKIIKVLGGSGWVLDDDRIKRAMSWLERNGISTSEEGALALAGIWKAKGNGWKLGKTVCLLTGKKY